MPLPSLEDIEADMDRACADVLGDTIQYAADGTTFVPLPAHGDYTDRVRPFAGAEAVEQDIELSMLKADVPAKPSSAVRITLPKLPGRTFRPINVGTDKSGTHWTFELMDVTSG